MSHAKTRSFLNLSTSLFALCALLSTASSAVWASDFHSPRTDALGGAGHAHPLLNDAIYLNPSFASFLQNYSASINYGLFHGGADQPDGSHELHGHTLNASVQDGRSELFQAGVGLTLRDDGKLIHIGASKQAIKQLGFGLGAKFYLPNQTGQDVTRDMLFSTTFLATDWFSTVFVVDNLISDSIARSRGFYREFILGTKFNIQGITMIYLDPHLAPDVPNQSSFGYETGAEFQPMEDIFLRIGMFRNSTVPALYNTRGRGYGLGIGWIGPRISFDYGLSRVVDPIANVTHNFGLTFYL